MLLKGADTLIADPGGRVCVSHAGAAAASRRPARATCSPASSPRCSRRAGDAWTATLRAAEAHGLRGPAARSSGCGPSGIIATDVIDALPEVLR